MSLEPQVIRAPMKGVAVDPPLPIDPFAFDDILNFFYRKGRMQTRPKLVNFGAPPDAAGVMYMGSFTDVTNKAHTLVLTTKTPYFLTAGAVYNALTFSGAGAPVDLTGTSLPFAIANIVDRVYFGNGSCKLLYADGEASVKVAGDVPGACRFLAVNAGFLISAFTTEPEPGVVNSKLYPRRVRWCKSGDPDVWVAAAAFSAGLNDLIEVSDQITGLFTSGRNTYVMRTNGITVMYPTGIGYAPFQFETLTHAPAGVGNNYPYSLAVFGDLAVFVARDDIYTLAGGQLNKIAGAAKKKIFADLNSASGGQVQGSIIASFGPGYDFLSYWLSLSPSVTWVFHYETNSWTRFSSAKGKLTTLNSVSIA